MSDPRTTTASDPRTTTVSGPRTTTVSGPSTTEGESVNQDRLLEHEYDGIREYDNRLPKWWQYTLYGAIVFSVVYWLVFHTFRGVPLPEARYEQEMTRAAEVQLAKMAGQELTNDALQLMATIPDRVSGGQQIFNQFCVVCHGPNGEGSVGPNLTDEYWLHGAEPLQIHNTVTRGVPDKGMAAWGSQLGPVRVQQVVAYVLTIKDKHLPGKPPQGERVGTPDEPQTGAPTTTEEAPVGSPAETPADAAHPLSPSIDSEGSEDVGDLAAPRSESQSSIAANTK